MRYVVGMGGVGGAWHVGNQKSDLTYIYIYIYFFFKTDGTLQ